MAVSGTTPLARVHTIAADDYDHPIKLQDATKTKDPALTNDLVESSGASLTRKWTRGTLRKELAKRKYAKWQEAKTDPGDNPGEARPNEG